MITLPAPDHAAIAAQKAAAAQRKAAFTQSITEAAAAHFPGVVLPAYGGPVRTTTTGALTLTTIGRGDQEQIATGPVAGIDQIDSASFLRIRLGDGDGQWAALITRDRAYDFTRGKRVTLAAEISPVCGDMIVTQAIHES